MEFEIKGGSLPVVICKLNQGETMFTQRGGMGWMSGNVQMATNLDGGFMQGLKRAISGGSFFMNNYTSTNGIATVAFPSAFPGSILALELAAGQTIICEKRTFLCAERSVQLDIFMQKKIGVGLFSGEGFVMQKVTGPGKVFLEIAGFAVHQILQPGEVIKADPGHIAAMTPSLSFNIAMVKGFKNLFFGGEGAFLCELTGPGEVWLQTITMSGVAHALIPFLPSSKSSGSSD